MLEKIDELTKLKKETDMLFDRATSDGTSKEEKDSIKASIVKNISRMTTLMS